MILKLALGYYMTISGNLQNYHGIKNIKTTIEADLSKDRLNNR